MLLQHSDSGLGVGECEGDLWRSSRDVVLTVLRALSSKPVQALRPDHLPQHDDSCSLHGVVNLVVGSY